tara:strand:+ start:295 stop:564 length:270 start_codon:yes stop_codon:yes gene_type:complete
MGIFSKIFSKSSTNKLWWCSQYISPNPKDGGTTIIHYSRSPYGVFEIYDDGNSFLLSFPHDFKLPASLFDNLDYAKSIAKHELDRIKSK